MSIMRPCLVLFYRILSARVMGFESLALRLGVVLQGIGFELFANRDEGADSHAFSAPELR